MLKDCPKAQNQTHRWLYDPSVYQPPIYCSSDCVTVHRQCILCGRHEIIVSKNWHKPYSGYELPDLRE